MTTSATLNDRVLKVTASLLRIVRTPTLTLAAGAGSVNVAPAQDLLAGLTPEQRAAV